MSERLSAMSGSPNHPERHFVPRAQIMPTARVGEITHNDRKCESCGLRVPPGKQRMRAPDGRLVCPDCHPDNPRNAMHTSTRHVAHDSGDGETIYHCPFCGSGGVVGRSDGSVECTFCDSVFTVQLQPQHPFMPQTINGQPVQMPGMAEPHTPPWQPGGEMGPNGSADYQPPAGAQEIDDADDSSGTSRFYLPDDTDPDEAAEFITNLATGAGNQDPDDYDPPASAHAAALQRAADAGVGPGRTTFNVERDMAVGANENLERGGGFSIDLHDRSPRYGYMVSIPGHEETYGPSNQITPYGIQSYMERHNDVLGQPGNHLGGWLDRTDNTVYLDTSQRFDDPNEAMQRGREWNQKAIYDIGRGDEIRLDTPQVGTGEGATGIAASRKMFITEDGVALREDQYLRHLACKHTNVFAATVAEVRASRS